MTTKCADCGAAVEVGVTHQGKSADGAYERGMVEATHAQPPCPAWKTTEHDLAGLLHSAS